MAEIIGSILDAHGRPAAHRGRLPSKYLSPAGQLPTPDGRRAGDCHARDFIAWGVEGISHEAGDMANLAAYAKHMEAIGAAGAKAAVDVWLKEHAPRSEGQ